MAKTKHHHFIDTVDECLSNAVKEGIFHLNTQDDTLDGRTIKIKNKKVVNFGSCSYLGLEMDERLKRGAIDATNRYGTQFSSSRAYLSCGLYTELEALFSEMFDAHAIVSPTTTLGHLSAIPTLVRDDDAIIMDQQVHGSVQNAVQITRPRGVHVNIIRHNDLEALEEKILELRDKYNRIWYMADGVYSMYGDLAPAKELEVLLNKYDQLRLYVDDAHGMSWAGKNGTGYMLSKMPLHKNMILATSLAKAFGTGGGVLVFKDKAEMMKVRTCGSTFIFSGPVQPPILGASIESAKIHLTDEIYTLQDKLIERISYCDKLIKEKQLPYLIPTISPIMYIPLGLPKMGYNMVNKLINEGFYVDIGIFPGVSVKRTGLRIAISNGQTMDDIKNLIDAVEHYYPIALKEENETIDDISKYFRTKFDVSPVIKNRVKKVNKKLKLIHERTIKNVPKDLWNYLLSDRGSFDWEGCQFLEETFVDNPEKENNWKFNYFVIRDEENIPVLATFFTELLTKDDMLSPESVSKQIEEKRKSDPYYLTSKVLMMGSLLTEGEHLYLDRKHPLWKEALILLLEEARKEQEKCGATAMQLRDLDSNDEELRDFLIAQGFAKVDMPDSHVVNIENWSNEEEFINQLSAKSRRHFRGHIKRNKHLFGLKIINKESEIKNDFLWNDLYTEVKSKKVKLNTFSLPSKLFKNVVQYNNWEVIELYLPEHNDNPVVSVLCFKSKYNYCPMIIGMNYQYKEFNIYRQALYTFLTRAKELNLKNVLLGMDASIEKKKFGAVLFKRSVYIQHSDENINSDLINLINQ